MLKATPACFDYLFLSNALIDLVQMRDLDGLKPEQMRIFEFCMAKPPQSYAMNQAGQSENWLKVFSKFKDYLLVSICDEELID